MTDRHGMSESPRSDRRIELDASEAYDRLDALSRPLAERVLRRAIELHDDEAHGPDQISRPQLEQIAAELGIAPRHVNDALAEELETSRSTPATGLRERILAPDRITGGRVVDGDRTTVERSVIRWMRGQEGLSPRRRTGAGYQWERDKHWLTNVRMTLGGTQSTKTLKNLPSVTHRQTDLGDRRQLVELDADTSIISKTATGVGSALSVVGAAAGVAVGVAGGDGVQLGEFLAAWLPATGVAIGSALAIAKGWASAVRKAIDRALDGIDSTDLPGTRPRRRRRSTVGRVIEDIGEAIDDLFE